MGFFSWNCNECGHPLLNVDATTDLNRWMNHVVVIEHGGQKVDGSYDGYGTVLSGCGAIELNRKDWFSKKGSYRPETQPCCYHHACWKKAGEPTGHVPSINAEDQGWFFNQGKTHQMKEPK